MTAAAKQTLPARTTTSGLPTQLEVLQEHVIRVLPAHVGHERFLRILTSAWNTNPALASADRASLLGAVMKCAQDGLLPDGREAVFTVFKTKDRISGKFVQKVQYMPMVFGILKKVRNSGELGSLTCNVVFVRDEFRYWVDDAGEHVTHEPNLDVPDRGNVRAAYAIAKTKDGGVYTEVMTVGQIEKVRAISKAKDDGPWVSWFDEMARKTVIRRLSKRLPMSTDIERTIQRDDALYSVQQRTERSGVEATRNVLGMMSEPVEPDDAEPPYEQKFDDDSALEAVATATTEDDLKDAWVNIANDYFETSRELPVRLQAAYSDRLEAIKQAASS